MTEPVRHDYGPGPDQFVEVSLPAGDGPAPVVVVVHGGFWRARYGIELARPLAADLAARGWAAVAVEYRRVGAGGGWPTTLQDVAAAVDALPDVPSAARLDLGDVTVLGHSAGGHLAAWTAGRGRLPAGAPGADPRVPVSAVVAQAGVLDLGAAVAADLGDGATVGFLGGTPAELPDRYAAADPVRLLPTGVPVLCVHGEEDTSVPLDQSRRFAAAAAAVGDTVEVAVVPGDHMAVIDVSGAAWRRTVDWLADRRTAAAGRTTLGS
ncbi:MULTISPECIES: alpha/beta hydrolase family protein [unclassified Modestobacter]|uniref:alpha/beta hydrolase family protein n=1 Tax=unclassified Modestobacter TaxID=2643866 RepID=UPI0022AAB8E1|nr:MULTISPECIES: alpha/beta hydrolase [unclassified Modestobacter]MCZ2814310.1 alpha/beta hydrolase [Modestobacter sp. VKM Ac-2979]MCZ2843998.1 alpha/beta hydrolase [Modestobacter sp. VKM Ac-2980]MCZ2850676.1 alpha/beta hydrolase [Modestobacter sp. VKM Ac-2978]